MSPGELAALGAALCWTVTALSFAAAGRRVGPTVVNLVRIILATVILAVVHRLWFGAWLPQIGTTSAVLLAVSGVIGLTIGDQLLFTALVDVGSRMSTLLMTLAPPVAAIIAWPVLDERLSLVAISGIAVTLGGVCWVVLERPEANLRPKAHRVRGVVFGATAGVCQAVGLILAKLGMGHGSIEGVDEVDPWSATLVRMIVAAVGMVVLAAVKAKARRATGATLADRRWSRALAFILLGTILGPVVGVWSSMVAIDLADAGIAATLMATTPVIILPFAVLIERDRVSWRAAAGAVVALAGIFLLTR